jgi:hypothetical protein
LGTAEEKEELKRWWYKMRREAWKKMEIFISSIAEEEIPEERNDVYIYKTLRYPPKSTPPTIN